MELGTQDILITQTDAATATGTTDITSSAVDMSANGGYDGCIFVCSYGTPHASTHVAAVSQCSTTGGSYADLAGSGVTITSCPLVILDTFRPGKTFLKARFGRATNTTTLGPIYAIRYRSRSKPQVNGIAATQALRYLISPAEGTAGTGASQ